jgi:hypothetical protein
MAPAEEPHSSTDNKDRHSALPRPSEADGGDILAVSRLKQGFAWFGVILSSIVRVIVIFTLASVTVARHLCRVMNQ